MTLILSGTDNSVSSPAVQGGTGGTTTGVYYPATNQLALATNGTQAVLVDSSQNVGIGTSSPSQKLSVVAGSGTSAYVEVQSTGFTSTLFGQNNAGDAYVYNGYAGNIRLFTGATERMRIDSSGNVGIGGSPNAWAGKATQIGTYIGFGVDANGYGIMANNAWNYTASSYKYTVSGLAASLYSQTFGPHNWYSASSGTAGNAIGFTQILSVDLNKSLALQGATSQSGTGITFPATQSASSDANTLDDYEEGSYTPTWNGGSVSGSAIYVKIGRLVYVDADVTFGTSASTALSLMNLPFTPSPQYSAGSMDYTTYGSGVVNVEARSDPGLSFRSGNGGNLQCNQAASYRYIFSITYFCTS
jgi:hypothetical protein